MQPRVAQQRDAVDGDGQQARQREVLVDPPMSAFCMPGRRETFPAIARPMITETVTHSSAAMPAARDVSHQP